MQVWIPKCAAEAMTDGTLWRWELVEGNQPRGIFLKRVLDSAHPCFLVAVRLVALLSVHSLPWRSAYRDAQLTTHPKATMLTMG